MMRTLALAAALLFAAAAARATTLNVSSFAQPGSVNTGGLITVFVQVNNPGAQYYDVSSSVAAFSGTGASATPVSTPVPPSTNLATSGASTFTWVFQGQACGSLYFSAWATGWDSSGSVTRTAGPASAGPVLLVCTPTPTFTQTPTNTPSPVVTATYTPTQTPWIVYGTATPGPLHGDASIPGNLFHPDQGQPLQLKFEAPLDATVSIDLYNRLGQRVRHIERHVSPGSYTELWDGRSDQGLLVSSGIYVAQFKAKGLFKAVKFAVVK